MIVIPLSPSPPSSSPHRKGPPNQAFLCNRRHILELFLRRTKWRLFLTRTCVG